MSASAFVSVQAPGNAVSNVRLMEIDPGAGGSRQQGNPPGTEQVNFVKIRSNLLSEF